MPGRQDDQLRGWLLHWAGIDRNPLRRGIDRVQAAVWAESLMVFLAGALVVTLQVSHEMYVSGLVYLRPAQRTTAGYEPASGNYEWCPNSNLFHSAEAAVPGPQVTVLPGKCWPCPKRPNARGLVDDRHRFSAASAGAARATPAVWAAAQMHHRAGFRIADAVRYMSVHSWKQPDSQGHGGTSQPRKQQPARPGIPSSRAVSAGSGRCCVVRTNVGLADGFTVSRSRPIGIAAELLFLHFPPREYRVLSVWRP